MVAHNPAAGQRRTRTSTGDFTGRQKAQLAREQAEASESRQAEVSMINREQDEAEMFGVFDAKSGARVNDFDPNEVQVIEPEEEHVPPGFYRPDDVEPVFTGQEDPAVVEPVLVQRRVFTPPEVVRSSMVTIRVDADIDQMTYGMHNGEPNNFNFREGIAYRVPIEVAEHLNERGLIRQWVKG